MQTHANIRNELKLQKGSPSNQLQNEITTG